MKPMQLIYALGDVDEAFIVEAAPAERKATVSPVWRWTAAAACILLAAGITWKLLPKDNGGVVPNQSTTTTTRTRRTTIGTGTTISTSQSTTQSTSQSTSQSTTPSTTQPAIPTVSYPSQSNPTSPGFISPNAGGRPHGSSGEAQGGGSNYAAYKADRFDDIPSWLRNWVKSECGVDLYELAMKEQEELKQNEGTWHRFYVTDKSRDVYNIVHKYEVPRALFEQLNEEAVKLFEPGEWSYVRKHYTPQEIEDIYTLSRIEFVRKYAAYDAIVTSDGVIYSFEWIRTHSVEDWREKGFTLAELQNAFEWAKHYSLVPEEDDTPEYLYFGCYMDRYRISDSGLTAFEEKLIRFTAEEAGHAVYGDGYNTYISHARWNSIPDVFMTHMVDTYGQEAVDAFKATLEAEKNGKFYASRGEAINRWVAHFGITRPVFEQLNEQLAATYAATYGEDSYEYWDNVYTDEEIADIYSLTLQEFNMKYAHPCTYVIGEYVYNFGWFLDKTWEDLWKYEVFKGRRLVGLVEQHAAYYPDETADNATFKKEAERYNFESGGK